MNCVRCGAQMPSGSAACPGCGLKIRQSPHAAQPPTGQPTPHQGPPAPAAPIAPVAQMSPPPSDPFAYTASPADPFAHPGYVSPGEVPPFSPMSGPLGAPNQEKDSSGKIVYFLVGAIVLALAVVGVLYFTVLKKPDLSGPEAAGQAFFAAMSNGDVAAVQALYAPDSVPTQEKLLQEMSDLITCRGTSAKIVNVKLSVSNRTATSAVLNVEDMTITASGRTASLSQMGPVPKLDQKVVLLNGQWLLEDH